MLKAVSVVPRGGNYLIGGSDMIDSWFNSIYFQSPLIMFNSFALIVRMANADYCICHYFGGRGLGHAAPGG